MPGQRKVSFIVFGLWEFGLCIFELFLLKKMAITQRRKLPHQKKNLHLFWRLPITMYKKLVLKYWDNARFPSLCLASENAFSSYFYSKNGHNSQANYDRTGKKFTLVLMTTYKKVFLKYQVNTRFPSLCLASENAIFGGGRKPRRRRK